MTESRIGNLESRIYRAAVGLAFLFAIHNPQSAILYAQYTGASQTNIISGVASNFISASGYVVGSNWVSNALIITGGGVLSNGLGYIGYTVAGSNNSVVVSGTGSAWSNNGNLFMGNSGAYCSMIISNGGTVVDAAVAIGYSAGANSNTVLVTDPNSVWTNTNPFYIGQTGYGNSLVISNGGKVFSGTGTLGYSAAGGSNNSAVVTGTGSAWNVAGKLTVGQASKVNSLVIASGGSVTCTNLTTSATATTSNNLITVNGGYLTVTTNSIYGIMDIRRCILTLNSGTITADNLYLTNNSDGIAVLNGGTLTVNNSLVTSNGVVLWFGLGTNGHPAVTTSNLTLNTVLNISDGGGFTYGTYPLITYTGTLTYKNVVLGMMPFGYREALDTTTVGKVNLVVTGLLRRSWLSSPQGLAVLAASNTSVLASYTTAGTNTWTCPAGITSVRVDCWGSGGGGATCTNGQYGGGGGGGAYAGSQIAVTPGVTYTYFVGGGAGVGYDGTNTWWNTNTVISAGGKKGTAGNPLGTGGLGGTNTDCTGDVKYYGGQGGQGGFSGTGAPSYGGGGGGSAGNASVGDNAATPYQNSSGAGGTVGGGNGGGGGMVFDSITQYNPGAVGNVPGGGGGGGVYISSHNEAGAAGANGQVKISWTHL